MNIPRLRAFVRVSLIILAGTAVVAQAARTQEKLDPPTGTGAIAGVIHDQSGTPVSRATVTVAGDMQLTRTLLSDEDGRFAIGDLPAGRFTVTAEKPGYPRMSYGAKTPFRNGAGVFLREGQSTSVEIALARGAVLTGTVYDERGEPMPGVGVMAWEIRTSLAGQRTLDMPATGGEWVITDERGMYRIYGLPPGHYTLGTYWAYHGQGFETRTLTPAELDAAFSPAANRAAAEVALPPEAPRYNYSPVFTPGVVDPLAAVTYALGPGDEKSGVDLRMQFIPMASVEASVTGPQGEPAGASRVTLTRRHPVAALNTGQVTSLTRGTYRSTSLSPSEYTLLVQTRASGSTPAMWALADFTLSPGEPLKLALTLQPALTVNAVVRVTSQTAAAPKDLSRTNVRLDWAGSGLGPDMTTTTTPGGHVTVTDVVPGRYVVVASMPAGTSTGTRWTVRSVIVDGQDVTDKPIEIGAGGIGPIDIAFADDSTEVSGTISSASGEPVADVFVVAIAADRSYWRPLSRRIASTRPDASGRYVFRNLPPGEYRIALTTDLVPRDLQNVEGLERLAAASAPFTIRAGETQTLDLKAGR